LEAEAVAEKEWTLKGEVTAKARPANSLLSQELDVDFASKPVPVITEEVTQSLEDMIRQRIKDDAFDDVVKKVVVQERAYDPNRRIELNDSKSSKSLADIYEETYLKETSQLENGGEAFKTEKDEALEKEHDEISQLFKGLCEALDALSNAHFTPAAPVLEIQVLPQQDAPAISIEEVIPATVSDAKLVTPEEVYDGKIKKSREEMDSQDKKRDRAQFKKRQKKENAAKNLAKKQAQQSVDTGRKRLSDSTVISKEKALKTLMGQENVTIIANSSTDSKTLSKGKANVIQKGGKVRQEKKSQRPEMLKL
jgi:U3 small nucleolar RNA-associated protein MPP10